jgi:PEGA domain-containing protein
MAPASGAPRLCCSSVPVSLALALGASLVLAAELPDAGTGRAGTIAVVALGSCDAPASAISARAFRAQLAQRLGPALQSEVDTAAPLGGLATRTLADLQHAVTEARAEFYKGRVSTAVIQLEGLSLEVTHLPPSDSRWAVERDLWTLLAQVRAKSSASSAEAALRRIYRVEPEYHPDTSLYPPSFRKVADKVRKEQAHVRTSRLDVAVSPPGTDVYVDGKKLGKAPVSLRLGAGSYRVEADFGHRSLSRTVQVPEPPQLAPPLELGAEVEGSLYPDGGPCVDPGKEPAAALARAASLLQVSRLLGIHGDGPADRRLLVLDEIDRSGAPVQQARARLSPGAPETEALVPLAELAATGKAPPGVEVVSGGGQRSGAAVEGRLVGQLLGSPPPRGFTLEAYGVEGHLARESVHLAGGRFELPEIPARRTVLHVVTDDGRVALAVAEAGRGELRKDLTLEQPCAVLGTLRDDAGRPVAGLRVFAALRPSGAWRASKTGPRGHFGFKDLVRGDYDLLAFAGRSRVALSRFSLSGTCPAELPAIVVPRAAVAGQEDGEQSTR